jgi:hypothetical protein
MNRNLLKACAILLFFCSLTGLTARSIAAGPASPAQEGLRAGSVTAGILASTSFSWVDITTLGAPFVHSDWVPEADEGHASADLPWPFPWFGETYTKLYIDINGNVGFEDWPVETWIGDNRIPSPGQPNNRIAAFYMDMAAPETRTCEGNGGAGYTYYDAAVDRFIVEYERWCTWRTFYLNTFEVILYPDGRVTVQYLDMQENLPSLPDGHPPGDSPAGIESPDGESGLIWNGTIRNGAAWLYLPDEAIGENRLLIPFIQQ